jgi:outer membrane lipase/esterase
VGIVVAVLLTACDPGGPGTPTAVPEAASGAAEHRQDVTTTHFFGSSTTDVGRLALLGPYVPAPPYFDGRVSNGPVWSEYFADRLGTDATISDDGGSNYALGGARTGVLNFGFLPPITTQVSDYLQETGGEADRRALYVFQTGANDLTAARAQSDADARQTMLDAVSFTREMVLQLIDAGARRFVLLTVPDLPTAPAPAILGDGTDLTALFKAGLQEIQAELAGAGVHIALLDLRTLVAEVHADPERFGLEVADCSYIGRPYLEVLNGDRTPDPCEPSVPVEDYMMYDDEHYTTAMHEIVADRLYGCHRYLRGLGSAATEGSACGAVER